MEISVTDAKAQLTDLVRRAEAGDDVVLTRHGQATVRLVPVAPKLRREDRRDLLMSVRVSAQLKAKSGPTAAPSHDDLYGNDGLPK